MGTLGQDLRYALRTMRRSPVFTAVAAISLALGAGANASIFTLINAVMLRPLPVRDPGSLVELLQVYPGEGRHEGVFSWQSYEHFRDQNHVFAETIATGPAAASIRGDGFELADGISERVS